MEARRAPGPGPGDARTTPPDRAAALRHDPARLAALRATGLLDTDAEPAFDRLTRLAVAVLGVPAAFLSLVDEHRDFYKAATGLPEPLGTTRELAGPTFCHLAIAGPGPLVIPDTAADPAYRDVPTVRSLGVAAYVGVPLVVAGQAVGSFCAIDPAPHAWTEAEVDVLRELAESALREIALRRANTLLEARSAALTEANRALEDQALELELANQQLQDQAAALERHAEELRATTRALAERTASAEGALVALAQSEARFRTVQDASPLGFGVHQALRTDDRPDGAVVDFTCAYINAAGARLLGTTPERLLGRRLLDVSPGTGAEGLFAAYVDVLTTGAPYQRELLYQHEGLDAGLALTAVRIGGEEVAVTFADVTARLRAEAERDRLLAALTGERERLRSLVLDMPAPVALHAGPEHRFELVNAAYRRRSGGRDVTGLTVRAAFPEFAGQGIFEQFDRVYQTGEPWVAREALVRYDRLGTGVEDTWFDLRFDPVRDADGRVVGVLNFSFDVTEQVRARRSVEGLLAESERARADAEAARAEADAANRAKGEFLAVMSHELRTPLNAIGGYAELLEMGIRGPVTGAQREDLARIQRSQKHLLGLINEVLNYTKLGTGTVRYDVADVVVCEALAEAEALVAPQARAKGLTLGASACPGDLAVRADPEKLRQVLVNLLSNAVKFTDRGGRVAVACDALGGGGSPGARVAIRVRDTGIGIPADKLEAIFEPFVQVRAALTRTAEGTGLGLAISRDLARGMGGDLTAESGAGAGSAFTLTLPRA